MIPRLVTPKYIQFLHEKVAQLPSLPLKIYVDRQTFMRLVQEADESTIVKVRNGTTQMWFREVPVYQVLDDEFHMEFISAELKKGPIS